MSSTASLSEVPMSLASSLPMLVCSRRVSGRSSLSPWWQRFCLLWEARGSVHSAPWHAPSVRSSIVCRANSPWLASGSPAIQRESWVTVLLASSSH